MNKDALLATIIGFGVGLVIAGIVFIGPTLFKHFPKFTLPNLSRNSTSITMPTPTPTKTEGLTIESPLTDAIEPKNETLVSGSTYPNTIVVLEGETAENVVVSNDHGAYAGKLSLTEGKNTIRVTSHAKTKMEIQTIMVFYTPEEF